jgi:ribosomal protein S18 acetylase RimI-like enzyme
MDGIGIRGMSPSELDAACTVIGLAFADNPNTLMMAGGDRAKAQRMMQAAVRVAKLGRKYSRVVVAEDAGRIVGVLNAAEWPTCQLTMRERLKTAPAMVRAMGLALPRALKMTSVWAKHDPRERHWHVGPIGGHPSYQGRGIASAMLGAFLQTVDDQKSPAYLETDVDRNVALYQTFGFKVIAHADVMGVDNRFMWRQARVARVRS